METFIDLGEQEMLALWKQVMRVTPVRRECVVERDDGIDLDAYLLVRLRQWYAHLLVTAPLEWVPVEDLKAEVPLAADERGVVTATLPERCVRPVEWMLAGWTRSVTAFPAADAPEAAAQRSEWTQGGPCRPAIVRHDDRLMLYGVAPGTQPQLVLARCVAVPAAGRYRFHADALATLPQWPT